MRVLLAAAVTLASALRLQTPRLLNKREIKLSEEWGKPPVNSENEIHQATVTLFTQPHCAPVESDGGHTFDSSGNEFLEEFTAYAHRTRSVRVCGEGSFLYFADSSMDSTSLLGHVTRCPGVPQQQDVGTKKVDGCVCAPLPPAATPHFAAFTLTYC